MTWGKKVLIVLPILGLLVLFLSCIGIFLLVKNFLPIDLGNKTTADFDADGVQDDNDNCVKIFNPTQDDRDKDGKGDACDQNIFLKAGIFDPISEQYPIPKELVTDHENGYYLIQFNESGDGQNTKTLLEQVEVIGFIPDNAFIVRVKSSLTKNQISNYPYVRFVDNFQPAYKLSSEILEIYKRNETDNASLIVPLQITVFKNIENVKSQISGFGIDSTDTDNTTLGADVPATKIIEIAKIDDVIYLEIKPVMKFRNNVAAGIINIYGSGKPNAVRTFGLQGEGQIIGIADSGLDTGDTTTLHPDLKAQLLKAFAWGRKNSGNWSDLDGHGTHVAGSAVGNGYASGDKIQGAAPAAKIIFQSLANNTGNEPGNLNGIPNDVSQLFKQVYDENPEARIHSNSWGGTNWVNGALGWQIVQEYSQTDQQIDKFMWEHKDMLIIYAAANDGSNGASSLGIEDNSKNILLVGGSESTRPGIPAGNLQIGKEAVLQTVNNNSPPNPLPQRFVSGTFSIVGDTDNGNDVPIFSSRGPASGNRIKPDIVSPATWILSTRSQVCVGADIPNSKFKGSINMDGIVDHNDCVGYGLPGKPAYGFTGLAAGVTRYTMQSLQFGAGLPGVISAPILIPSNPNLPDTGSVFYMYDSGNSMAAPMVAGSTALVRQYYQQIKEVKKPSAALLKATIINGAQDMPATATPGETTASVPNYDEGFGRVDIGDSLFPNELQTRVWFKENKLSKEDEEKSYLVRASKDFPLWITLAWTDYPSDIRAAGPLLVNDLDLKVISPSGKRYAGNLMTGGISTENPAAIRRDFENNVEKVIIPAPEDGFYNITIKATKLGTYTWGFELGTATREQEFAVVASENVGVDSGKITESDEFEYKRNFTNEYQIRALAQGLKENEGVTLYVMNYRTNWFGGLNLKDVNSDPIKVKTDATGIINSTNLWTEASNWIYYKDQTDADGRYQIVVDRNNDGKYDFAKDLVDYKSEPGFRVQAVAASDSSGSPKKIFTSSDNAVYAYGGGFESNSTAKLDALIDQNNPTSKRASSATVKVKDDGTTLAKVWTSPTNYIYNGQMKSGNGIYLLRADANSNGLYDKNDSLDQVQISILRTLQEDETIKIGDNETEVGELQIFLNAYGEKVNVTGKFDETTKDALNRYFQSRSLEEDGKVDIEDIPTISKDADTSFTVRAAAVVDESGAVTRIANNENIYAIGRGLQNDAEVRIYLINHIEEILEGSTLIDVTDNGYENATADENGSIEKQLLWKTAPFVGEYNLIIDANDDGKYNSTVDTIDKIGLFRIEELVKDGEVANVTTDKNAIEELQTFLKVFVDSTIIVDGTYTQHTQDAIRKYQKRKGLGEGDFDKKTFEAMEKDASVSIRIQSIQASWPDGKPKSTFQAPEDGTIEESVYATASGFQPNSSVRIYVVRDQSAWIDRDMLTDVSGSFEETTTDSEGDVPATLIWKAIKNTNSGEYDIVIDTDKDGKFTNKAGIKDGVSDIKKSGFSIKTKAQVDWCGENGTVTKEDLMINAWRAIIPQNISLTCRWKYTYNSSGYEWTEEGILYGKKKALRFEKKEYNYQNVLTYTTVIITKDATELYTLYPSYAYTASADLCWIKAPLYVANTSAWEGVDPYIAGGYYDPYYYIPSVNVWIPSNSTYNSAGMTESECTCGDIDDSKFDTPGKMC